MAFSMRKLGPIIFGGTPRIITYLRSKGLLASTMTCSFGTQMVERVRNDISDGIRWKCPNTACNTSKSVRVGSFFDKSRLELQQWLMLLFYWVDETPVTVAIKHVEITEKTAY